MKGDLLELRGELALPSKCTLRLDFDYVSLNNVFSFSEQLSIHIGPQRKRVSKASFSTGHPITVFRDHNTCP